MWQMYPIRLRKYRLNRPAPSGRLVHSLNATVSRGWIEPEVFSYALAGFRPGHKAGAQRPRKYEVAGRLVQEDLRTADVILEDLYGLVGAEIDALRRSLEY